MKKESITALNLKTITCVPLKVDDQVIGVVYVDSNRDTGIPPEVREKLFQCKFNHKTRWAWLWIEICKKIVENHNGKIEVISELGNGTEFIISISTE